MGSRTDLGRRIEGARIHVAGLHAHDRRTGEARHLADAHPPLTVNRNPHHARASEAQHAQRLDERGMDLVSHDHRYRRRAEQAVGLDIPSGAFQNGVPGGSERREIGDRRAGDKRPA